MAAVRPKDQYANRMLGTVVMSVADTLTFQEILTNASLQTGMAILIDKIEYSIPGPHLAKMTANEDYVAFALSTTNTITDIMAADNRVIHKCHQVAQGASILQSIHQPFVHTFEIPLIVATPKLYAALDSSGTAAALTGNVVIYFRYLNISPQQYLEIAEAFQSTS